MHPDLELQHSRTLLLPGLEPEQLESLGSSEVWVIGLGGLGALASLYLASTGVGCLQLVDPDTVELSNLPRQVLYGAQDLGQPKAQVAAARLRALYPGIKAQAHVQKADAQFLSQHLSCASLVLDCTDRFASRHAINQYCAQQGLARVIASVVGWEGQLMVCSPTLSPQGCYACSFPRGDEASGPAVDAACGAFGVFPTMAGLMALLQAQEGLKLLLGLAPERDLLLVQGPRLELVRIRRQRLADCPDCSDRLDRSPPPVTSGP